MRGTDEASGSLFSYVDLAARISARHPLRKIRQIVNDALASLDGECVALYTDFGRPSIAPFLSDDHFSVDGTLAKAWASMKSFQPKAEFPPPDDDPARLSEPDTVPHRQSRNAEADLRGEKRSNAPHASTTIRMPGFAGNPRARAPCFALSVMRRWRTGPA